MEIVFLGLGNPGRQYLGTRHNAGRDWLDFWQQRLKTPWRRRDLLADILRHDNLIFAKPLVFMNESGRAAKQLLISLKLSPANLCLIHDELDLPLGQWKLSFARSSRLHKGVLSVEKWLQTRRFWRLRLGVDNRSPYQRLPGETYVLQKFLPSERPIWRELLLQLRPEEIGRQIEELSQRKGWDSNPR